MAILKSKDIKKMSKNEREGKIKELKLELIKSNAKSLKKGSNRKEIKKIIARILTLDKINK